jgi:transposase, IS30 family
MGKYHQLSLTEREKMFAFKTSGLSLRAVARKLGRSPATISRELRRNAKYYRPYIPCRAHNLAKKRGERQRYKAPLKCPFIFLYVRKKLRTTDWSPETIAGRLHLKYPQYSIDDDTIYRYIYSKRGKRFKLYNCLLKAHPRRQHWKGRTLRKDRIEPQFSFENRPEEANDRLVVGHWETDNVEGLRVESKALSVSVERVTRLTKISLLPNQTGANKTKALRRELLSYSKLGLVKTITCDRGKENSKHKLTSKQLSTTVYFCNAYHSWEKGTVENMNGRIRRYIPKKTSLENLTPRQVSSLENILNNTPRKCLKFLTPNERMAQITNQLSVALPLRM